MGSSTQPFPELPYSLHGRYRAIAIAWTMILFPPCILNLALFYGLWYGTTVSRVVAISIPTAIFGGFTVFSVFLRLRRLLISAPTYRPLDSPRAALDPFQWGYLLGIIIVTAEIVTGLAVPSAPLVRLLSMPVPSLMFELALLAGITLFLQITKTKAPFRIGSFPAGSEARPLVYYLVEDIVAVDGGAGIEYRKALDARYVASPLFRKMLWNVTLWWMIVWIAIGAAITAIVFTVKKEVAYGIAWVVPVLLSGLMVIATVQYVKRSLRVERREWAAMSARV